jgi:pantothenate kinase type III
MKLMADALNNEAFDVFTINVGNTHCRMIGWHRDGAMAPCLEWQTQRVVPKNISTLIRQRGAQKASVVVAGVVPDYKEGLRARFEKDQIAVAEFREDLPAPIEIVPKPSERVGDDRIAGALGALYLDPKCPWVVVDVGTAVTVNAVRPARGRGLPRFEGGLIFPGAEISLRALTEHTAQLPELNAQISAARPVFIGKNTEDAMRWGVYHAQREAAVALAKAQVKILGARTRIALTGGGSGDAFFVSRFRQAFPKRGMLINFGTLVHLGLFAAWKAQTESKRKR